ncbi:FAD-dependent oxidoreductase [Streptomyces chrestomyceticus]|uniref:FAD-dependent oxidoreductase n=1 Tax=Streptomyces chrestomyceticus TaxID=68185 RepID=UPI003F4CBA79
MSTAWELARAGHRVAVLEADRIAAGVSGYTTAKVSVLHTLVYAVAPYAWSRRCPLRRAVPAGHSRPTAGDRGGTGHRVRSGAAPFVHLCGPTG